MSLPITPPLQPQLARSKASLPEGEGWAYEPKWDGFRAIAFVDGDDVFLQSRNGKPLLRYFPELSFPAGRYVLDGEIVVRVVGGAGGPDAQGEDWRGISQRIHSADSYVQRMAREKPATFMAFDLLARGDESLLEVPFAQRRAALEELARAPQPRSGARGTAAPIELTPSVRTPAEAEPWLASAEGVVAKELGAPYVPGKRAGMVKVKRVRTIDAVVVGWRPGKEEGTVGSLILGLYDEAGTLHGIGHTSGFKAAEKRSLVETLAPYETGERGSADPSRWRPEQELEWRGLRPELVVEITFDHVSDGRIRHGTKIVRWRDDKDPRDCALSQLRA